MSAPLVKQAAGQGKPATGPDRILKTSDASLLFADFPAYPCPDCSISFSEIKVWVGYKFESPTAHLLSDTIYRTLKYFSNLDAI